VSKGRLWLMVIATAIALWWLHPKPGAEHSADVTEVTIWFNGLIEGRHLDAVDAFERRFPEYKSMLGSSAVRTGLEGEGNPQRLMCGIAGGVPPEVVEYDRFAVCQWAARGAFLDLNPLIERDQQRLAELKAEQFRLEAAGAPADEVDALRAEIERFERFLITPDQFYPATWNECAFQGGQYGVPNYMDNRVLYYNADLLVQAGFADEQGNAKPPDTWEQLLRKTVDVADARIAGDRISSDAADFVAAGVQPGDTLSHLDARGKVQRCLVAQVIGPHELLVESPYANRALSLIDGTDERIKVFDQNSYALKLSRWDDDGRLRRVGFEPQHGNAWLYLYGWANGGQFLSEDGLTCTLDDPRIVEALQWTTDIFDAYGGASDVVAFRKSFQTAAQDPFFIDQIAMLIHGDWFLRDLARYRRQMNFGTYPAPVPAARAAAGERYISWIAGFAYCIPATCPPEKLEAAWSLVKFLSSVEGGMVMNEHDAQRERGQGRLYMPRLMASKPLMAEQMRRYVEIPATPERVRAGLRTHLEMLPYCKYRPVSPLGQALWNAQADAQDVAWNHGKTPADSLQFFTERVQRELDEFYSPPKGFEIKWRYGAVVYVAGLLVLSAGLYWNHKRRHRVRGFHRQEWWAGIAFAGPWLAGFIVLSGGPMLFSAVMSVTEYDVINPARFVGLQHYQDMFGVDWADLGGTAHVLGNTLYMAIGLPINMAVGLALALLLNAKVRGMSWYRTLFFLPAIMPVVAASVLWIWVFNAQNGLMNALLDLSGTAAVIDWSHAHAGLPVKTPISWLTDPLTSKPALIIMTAWTAGASMIIWLAGLKEIPKHLYEAAALDGAGVIRRFVMVTLPLLSPYILFNLIIGLIQTFQIFTQAYIMTPNGSPNGRPISMCTSCSTSASRISIWATGRRWHGCCS
jgi:ABC-type sugar transport system permease subunit/ABC-type glycerol-3-phosphate transport system substrate-binding protein